MDRKPPNCFNVEDDLQCCWLALILLTEKLKNGPDLFLPLKSEEIYCSSRTASNGQPLSGFQMGILKQHLKFLCFRWCGYFDMKIRARKKVEPTPQHLLRSDGIA